jgi:hypothetical protein
MSLTNELGMDVALDVFAAYFAFDHEYNELAQRLATQAQSATQTQSSAQAATPNNTAQTPAPMDVCK